MRARFGDRAVSADGPAPQAQLPPPGWIYDPSTEQTRWWDGAGWTHHELPLTPAPMYGTIGTDPQAEAPVTAKNGQARAALILILVQLRGTFGIAALAFTVGSWGLRYL